MKKILIYFFAQLWLLASCQVPELIESAVSALDPDQVEVKFTVLLPEEGEATKALGDEPSVDIKSLHLVVFDENGYYIETCEASWDPGNTQECNHPQEQPFTVTLRKTEKERIIHFIANCPVDQIHYGHESDIISSLYTQRGNSLETAYWYRTQVWYIKTKQDQQTKADGGSTTKRETLVDEVAEAFKCVPLLRNFASITVKDNADDFVMESYAVYNTIDKGTVAPYNVNTHGFQNFLGSDGKLLTYPQLLADGIKYEGHASAEAVLKYTLSDADFKAPGTPTYMYERKVSVRSGVEHQWSESPPHIIIKGRYNNAAAYSYYKVDMLYYENGKGYYYNILRNFKYTFTVNKVAGPGYSTLEEAMNNPAGNNLAGATDTQGFTNVSDGLGRIFVSHTDTTMTSGDDIVLRYKYVPSIQNYNVVANERVEVEGILDGTGSVIKGVSKIVHNATDDGWAEVTFKVQSPGAITHLQEVVLNVKDNANLHKTIRYRLQKPLTMKVNCWPKAIAKFAGRSINVAIRLPEYMTKDMFPLDLAIEVEQLTLSPDASKANNEMPVEPDYSIVPDKKGKRSYHFVKTIETYEDYVNLERYEGEKLVNTYWLTTKAANASKVYVYNKYFTLANDDFYNAEEFTLLEFPDGVKKGVGNSVTFQFNMNTITPVTVTLEGLTNANGETTFVYTPASLGRQILTLKTAQDSGTVTVTLRADKYADTSLSAVQTSEVNVPTLTVKFTYPSRTGAPQANAVKPTLAMSGNASVSYGSISNPTRTRNGNTYDFVIPFRDLLIKDASDDSVLSISYTTGNYTFKGTITVSELKGDNPTVTLRQ